jgi:hypothetical protein
MSKAQKVGAAWVKEIDTKAGKQKILSVTIGKKRYTLFKNSYKEQPKHPDYVVYEDNYTPKEKHESDYAINKSSILTDEPDGNDLPF